MLEFTLDLTGPKAQKIMPDALRHDAGVLVDVRTDLPSSIGA
jgi:hypothetical protein